MTDVPLVSVVVPTYNSEAFLEVCLRSIREQTYENVELIVVDGGSDDRTVEIANSFDATLIRDQLARSEARNVGIRKCTGEFLLSIDSDMELSPSVITECVEVIEADPLARMVVIPERSIGSSIWVKTRDFERGFYANTCIESARFFRMDDVRDVGGYNEDFVFFEEATLPAKVAAQSPGTQRRIDAEIIHHEEQFQLADWLRKKYSYGRSIGEYREHFEKQADERIDPVKRYKLFIEDWRTFLGRPVLAFFVMVLKTLEFVAAGAGYLREAVR